MPTLSSPDLDHPYRDMVNGIGRSRQMTGIINRVLLACASGTGDSQSISRELVVCSDYLSTSAFWKPRDSGTILMDDYGRAIVGMIIGGSQTALPHHVGNELALPQISAAFGSELKFAGCQ